MIYGPVAETELCPYFSKYFNEGRLLRVRTLITAPHGGNVVNPRTQVGGGGSAAAGVCPCENTQGSSQAHRLEAGAVKCITERARQVLSKLSQDKWRISIDSFFRQIIRAKVLLIGNEAF